MAVIDHIVELLSDGDWYDKGQIERQIGETTGQYSDSVNRKLREYSHIPHGQVRPKPFYRKGKRLYLIKKLNEKRKGSSYKLEEHTIYDEARALNKKRHSENTGQLSMF